MGLLASPSHCIEYTWDVAFCAPILLSLSPPKLPTTGPPWSSLGHRQDEAEQHLSLAPEVGQGRMDGVSKYPVHELLDCGRAR